MNFEDYTKTRDNIIEPESRSIFSQLLKKTVKKINDLRLFRQVKVQVRKQTPVTCPGCLFIPRTITVAETHLSGARFDYRYNAQIGIVLKHPNDSIMIDYLLYYAEALRKNLSVGDVQKVLVFSDVSGHYNTNLEDDEIGILDVISEKVLLFSSGINIVYSVWATH